MIGRFLLAPAAFLVTFSYETMAADCTATVPAENKATKTWTTSRAKQSAAKWTQGRIFEHVVIVVFENHDYDEVMSNTVFKSVGERGAVFSRFVGSYHPSYPNYLAMVGARYFGTVGDDQTIIDSANATIVDELEGKGLTWSAYAERYAGQCVLDENDATLLYRRKHVPFLSFASITENPNRCEKVVNFEGFDWKRLPNYSFVTPDMCNDGHDREGCTGETTQIARAAAWLEKFLAPTLENPDLLDQTLVVITFDESRSYKHNHVYTAFLGGMVKPGGRENACLDHFNVLRTIEENFSLTPLGGEDSRSAPITAVWK